ncbi:Protein CBG00736 [Caenorhabditis briggsae]|uniref:Protein CBG00736 n=2 Tax=Caenorhabditis briggsae TaxID=6238 RepID=A8WN67_CAEBR|nr:Protein CBG00736 [Caenorhabditis briggsae]CAP21922.2 Protein CBG00736 [Caenorhabditis briggsae]
MSTRYDYGLLEFTANLAEAEATYGQKLQSIIDTFSQSRLDLPIKRLSEIAKVHTRTAANLKKYMDPKKNEHLNLWKFCNVYSCGAVDLDKAMRETRSSLRTKMAVDGTVIEKPKRRNIFNSIQNHLNSSSSSYSTKSAENSEKVEKDRRWFPKLPDRKLEFRTSRKTTSSSVEEEKVVVSGSMSTPQTPQIVRAHSQLTSSVSVAPDLQEKPPRPPIRTTVPEPTPIAQPPVSVPVYTTQPYATPIYGDLQKASNPFGINNNINNNRMGIVEEHLLRHQDDAQTREMAVVRIRTDVDVYKEMKKNEAIMNVYDSPLINKSHYVNIRPPIAQKPKIMAPAVPSPPNEDVSPTFISVECYQAGAPTPSPRRAYYNTNDIPSSQRSSSSAYSSNYSSASSSNVTSFAVDNPPSSTDSSNQNLTPGVVENARYVRIASPDGVHHRF